MLAISDALVLVLNELKGFTRNKFGLRDTTAPTSAGGPAYNE